jgi:hypothetical protein
MPPNQASAMSMQGALLCQGSMNRRHMATDRPSSAWRLIPCSVPAFTHSVATMTRGIANGLRAHAPADWLAEQQGDVDVGGV